MHTDISSVWTAMWQALRLTCDATIIEVGPGFKSKIGGMLHRIGFAGTLYVVEPNATAGQHTMRKYRALMPRARIEWLDAPLSELRNMGISGTIDAIMGNHVLDDMILAECIDGQERDMFFSMNSSPERICTTRMLWDSLSEAQLRCAIDSVCEQWTRARTNLNPRYVVLSQYESRTLRAHRIHIPHYVGTCALARLRQQCTDAHRHDLHTQLTHFGHTQEEWLIMEHTSQLFADARGMPEAASRLHPEIFCEEAARALTPDEYDVVYTNTRLLRELYPEMARMSDDEISSQIGAAYTLRLTDIAHSHDTPPIRVYSDRQKDPTDIALDGHSGSGRACYVGSRFNIKGIGKTKLLGTPKDPIHATGTLDVITALREAVMSSWIHDRIACGTSQTVAVIALREEAMFPWSDSPIRLALLVRLDDGTLDRPSHLVHTRPRREIDSALLTQSYARMDADLFAYRVLHGAWSTGNVSLSGNILDMESVSFLRGRGMHYTITAKYESNRFGCESLGWKQVIAQVAHSLGQADLLSDLLTLFDATRDARMHTNMLRMLGYPDAQHANIMRVFGADIATLTRQFVRLSTMQSDRTYDPCVFHSAEYGAHVCDMTHLHYDTPRVHIRPEEMRWLTHDRAAQIERDVDRFVRMVRNVIDHIEQSLSLTRDMALSAYMHRDMPNFVELTNRIIDITREYSRPSDMHDAIVRLIYAY